MTSKTQKLFSQDQIVHNIGSAFGSGEYSDVKNMWSDVILHRSIYRDYFQTAMLYLERIDIPRDQLKRHFDDFSKRFLSYEYDFVSSLLDSVAVDRGWVNPYGWDRNTGQIIKPLTNLFSKAAHFSVDLQHFHETALSGKLPLTDYERMVILYVEIFSKYNENVPVYDGIIQTQSTISAFSIRLRQEFEDYHGRQMTREDWNSLLRDMKSFVMRLAMGARVDVFKNEAMTLRGSCPFDFSKIGSLGLNAVDDDDVHQFMQNFGLMDYFNAIKDIPVTGCPVMHSQMEGGKSYIGFIVETLFDAVREDFWPMREDNNNVQSCPYHHGN